MPSLWKAVWPGFFGGKGLLAEHSKSSYKRWKHGIVWAMESLTNKSEWLEEAPVHHTQGWQIKFLYCSGSIAWFQDCGSKWAGDWSWNVQHKNNWYWTKLSDQISLRSDNVKKNSHSRQALISLALEGLLKNQPLKVSGLLNNDSG